MTPLTIWLASLGATLAVELPLVAAAAPRGERARFTWAALWANLTTHSLASAFLPGSTFARPDAAWLLVEAVVIGVEGLAIRLATGGAARAVWRVVILANVLSAFLAAALAFGGAFRGR